jgi:hypothetical protein
MIGIERAKSWMIEAKMSLTNDQIRYFVNALLIFLTIPGPS